MVEQKTQGLRKPKRKSVALDQYEKKYGLADPTKIKTQRIDGVEVRGIDVINAEDVGVYECIDEPTNAITRQTMLSSADVVL